MSLSDQLINKKVVLVSGKGGIGKTVITAALGKYAAAHGKKVCLIECAAQDQLAPLFGHEPIGHHITNFSENIYGINLNADDNFRDFVVKHLGHEKLFNKVFSTTIVKSLIKMLPGVAELTLLGRIFYTAKLSDRNFDLVIFDAYSSGHFLNLLTTPTAIFNSGLAGPVLKETQKLIDFYQNPDNTAIALVTTPEELVMSEVKDFLPKIEEAGLASVGGVFVNHHMKENGAYDELMSLCESPQYAAAAKYAMDLFGRNEESLADFDIKYPVQYFPELGAIEEPLGSTFVDKFFKYEGQA